MIAFRGTEIIEVLEDLKTLEVYLFAKYSESDVFKNDEPFLCILNKTHVKFLDI